MADRAGSPGTRPQRGSSARAVYAALRSQIEDGRFAPGSPLPKVRAVAAEKQVSVRTVCEALAGLERDNLVHRVARAYHVGRRPTAAAPIHRRHGPVVLLLQASEDWWREMLTSEWFAPFGLAFMQEVERAGAQVVPAFLHKPEHDYLLHGEREVRECVKALGSRYLGMLITGQSWDYTHWSDGPLPAIVSWAVGLGGNVVWFDGLDETSYHGGTIDSGQLASLGADRRAQARFTRCRLDERGAVRLALETLSGLGHRRIGVPYLARDSVVWGPARVRLLRDEAAEMGHMAVHVRAARRSAVDSGALARVIKPLLHEDRVTALVALNDETARHVYAWLRRTGLEVPGDVSLLSFDSRPRQLYPWQISSVDFGFGYLGHSAYHLLARDIPFPRKGVDLPARCHVNHLGSLGRPDDAGATGGPRLRGAEAGC